MKNRTSSSEYLRSFVTPILTLTTRIIQSFFKKSKYFLKSTGKKKIILTQWREMQKNAESPPGQKAVAG